MLNVGVNFESRMVKALSALMLGAALFAMSSLSVHSQTVGPVRAATADSFDSDLATIQSKIRQIREIAGSCTSGECVDIPCRNIKKLNEDVFNADYYLRYALVWNRTAFKKHRALWYEYVNLQTASTERASELELQTAYMEFVTGTLRAAADIAVVVTAARSFDASSFRNGSALRAINQIDDLLRGISSFEELRSSYRRIDGHDETHFFQISDPDLRLLRSTASNVRTIVQNARDQGRDWRTAFKNGFSKAAAVQLMTRVALAFTQSEIDKRIRRSRETEREIEENNRQMAATFNASRLYSARLNKIERAYTELNGLLTRNGDAYWLSCNRTNCILRPQSTAPSPPVDFRVSFTNASISNARPVIPDNWLDATVFFDGKLSQVARMTVPDSVAVEPRITLEKRVFEPGEIVNATFTARTCYPFRSWIGVIPSRVIHGNITTNIGSRISSPSYLKNRASGAIVQRAPNEEGSYDLRMNDIGSNNEVYSTSFEVRKPEETPTPQPSPGATSENESASWLIGRWEGYENNLGYSSPYEIGIEIEFVREDGKISGYIRQLSKNARESRYRVGEKIYRNVEVGGEHVIWKFHARAGQSLYSTFSKYNDNGSKNWQEGGILKIVKGKNWLEVGSYFWLMRFRKIQ